MGILARDVVVLALVLFQLLSAAHSYQMVRGSGGRKLELPKRGLSSANNTKVLRSRLISRDSLTNSTAKSPGEKFLAALQQSQSRLEQLQATSGSGSLTSPLTHAGGGYAMQISFGTPAQHFTALADTGSDLVWVQCNCDSDGSDCFSQPDPSFNSMDSSTYSATIHCSDDFCQALGGSFDTCSDPSSDQETCSYTYSYGDKSYTEGNLAYETVTLDSAVPMIAFGCGTNNAGTLQNKLDGLVGLGLGALSLPSQLSQSDSIAHVFSYCLVLRDSNSGQSSPLTFGDAAENSAVTYTPLVANSNLPSFYFVEVQGISVGGTDLGLPASTFQSDSSNGGVILDSGTTFTMWPADAYNAIQSAYQQQVTYPQSDNSPSGFTLCFDTSSASDQSNLSFPVMVVHMTGVDFETPGSTLFIEAGSNVYCLAMQATDRAVSIIGNIQQQNHLIVYDVANNQVGFQATDCSSMSS